MFRTTTLATLSVLALSGCIATPASAQYMYGNVHGGFAHGRSYSHHDHGHGYYYGHADYHGYGRTAYPSTALSRRHAIPVYAETACPYRNESVCNEPNGCPLQRGRSFPNRLTDEYQPGFGLASPSHDHSRTGDHHGGHSHDGHAHEGHSHEGHSHDLQIPGRDVAPSDRDYIAPPSLPRDSVRDYQPQQGFRREQPQPNDSIRMDGPPSSPAPPRSGNPKRFDVPPPPTV